MEWLSLGLNVALFAWVFRLRTRADILFEKIADSLDICLKMHKIHSGQDSEIANLKSCIAGLQERSRNDTLRTIQICATYGKLEERIKALESRPKWDDAAGVQ